MKMFSRLNMQTLRAGVIKALLAALLIAVPLSALSGDDADKTPAPAKSPLDRFSPEQRRKLLAGEAVFEHVRTKGGDGKLHGHGQSSVLINTPVDKCFKIFCEFNKQQLYFPRKKTSEVVKTDGNKVLVHKVFDFYVTTIEYHVIYTVDKDGHRVDFQMDPAYPHDIEDTAGFFRFEKVDGQRTLFTYAATKVETGLKVPEFIQDYITSRDLPEVVINVKKRIESGGTWTKD